MCSILGKEVETMIAGKNISLSRKGKKILNNVNFEISRGSIATFIGKSGSGKTSLLKCIGGLYPDLEGEIVLEGTAGFVFQQYHLFPHMTVLENCVHPLCKIRKEPRQEAEAKVLDILEEFEIKAYRDTYPSELSGGQQQRVALTRALCLDPDVLLLDEPTAALDPDNTQRLIRIIQELHKKQMTLVISTHDLLLLRSLMDNVYFMQEGTIIESLHPFDALASRPSIQGFLS
jgi:polar amino acid transport system ATP-binding protein